MRTGSDRCCLQAVRGGHHGVTEAAVLPLHLLILDPIIPYIVLLHNAVCGVLSMHLPNVRLLCPQPVCRRSFFAQIKYAIFSSISYVIGSDCHFSSMTASFASCCRYCTSSKHSKGGSHAKALLLHQLCWFFSRLWRTKKQNP